MPDGTPHPDKPSERRMIDKELKVEAQMNMYMSMATDLKCLANLIEHFNAYRKKQQKAPTAEILQKFVQEHQSMVALEQEIGSANINIRDMTASLEVWVEVFRDKFGGDLNKERTADYLREMANYILDGLLNPEKPLLLLRRLQKYQTENPGALYTSDQLDKAAKQDIDEVEFQEMLIYIGLIQEFIQRRFLK